MPQQHFFIEGKFLGTAEREAVRNRQLVPVPPSYAFVCPTCGTLWASCPVLRADGSPSPFMVNTSACRKHPAQPFSTEPQGILHLTWDPEFSKSFPDEVVRWEFDRYMEFLSYDL